MKMTKLFIAAAMLAVSATASAQFTNTAKTGSSSAVDTDGWGTFYLQWNPSTIKIDVNGIDDQSFTGFSVGYNHAFGIVKNTPLFIETGVALQYSFYTVNWKDDLKTTVPNCDPEDKYNMLSAKVPVNLIYKFNIPNSNVAIAPYFGANLRFNISGKSKTEFNEDAGYEIDKENWENKYGKIEKDLFDKKDMESKDATWKRFQIGWQIGANAHFGENFLLGISYGSDFSELYKKAKINTTSITLGYKF